MKPIVNIGELAMAHSSRGDLYGSSDVRIGPMIGVRDLGITYSEVPPGKSHGPFHNHHVQDEMFLILEGTGRYRFGPDSYPIKAGDVLGAPAGGPETAHQITNTGSTPLRYYAISTMSLAEVCEYPDSGKFAVYSRSTRNPYDKSTVRHVARSGTSLDYWDGEPGAESKDQ